MKLMAWIQAKLENTRRSEKYAEAMRAVDEFTVRARSLREQLEPYTHEDDPFAAIVSKRDSAEEFTERTFREPPE